MLLIALGVTALVGCAFFYGVAVGLHAKRNIAIFCECNYPGLKT